MSGRDASLTAISRSLDVYYRDHARTARMDQLNAQFVRPGALAFDIGAHVGDRTASFLRLGARVIALEPQPKVFRALRLLHGRTPEARLLQQAVGAQAGEMRMFVNTANPTVSTASHALVTAARGAHGWSDQIWDERLTVPVTTFDQLIADHGTPEFAKIDVEGHELDVLLGLSSPIPTLSFEVTMLQRSIGADCIDRLHALAPHQFNLSLGEDHALRHPDWLDAGAMKQALAALPDAANSGDVYARLL